MAKTTGIEWADSTWNPWRGCKKVSAGCKNCYAERDMKRFGHDFNVPTRSKTTFRDPLKWKEPKHIFVCSWSDFFWEEVPEEWRKEAWAVMAMSSRHTFLLLTKRPENIPAMLPNNWTTEPYPNVWLGMSAENQENYDKRILQLVGIPAARRFISAEPLIGPIDLGLVGTIPRDIVERYTLVAEQIHWVITGGESGGGERRRIMPLDWARSIRDQCLEAEVSFFHKQHGGTQKIDGAWGGRELDGQTWDEIPIRNLRES